MIIRSNRNDNGSEVRTAVTLVALGRSAVIAGHDRVVVVIGTMTIDSRERW